LVGRRKDSSVLDGGRGKKKEVISIDEDELPHQVGSIDSEASIEAVRPIASIVDESIRRVLTSGSVRIGEEKIIASGRKRIQATAP